ncbi:VOC family protein [Asticcacaulis endophyticus]|uniref:VOC domain-containing protein n=1 Tax=Asticcacaulis endophyticus TaxID=1395890 RepID=A0A918QGI2_9CAUL|nr:VOC family protein [Asticcacaulis endophyticus]GGZ44625.1 hypothetical protein GCM10011273_34260 [Asticcacaulis endophyticus]
MPYPNTLIFVDLPAEDPTAAGIFYAEVFGWENEPRPNGLFHRLVPGGFFRHKDGSDSEIANLHLAIYRTDNARPYPDAYGAPPHTVAGPGRKARTWILVSDDDTPERILEAAETRGAKILWRDHFCKEFNGFNYAFMDPWGNEIVLWVKGGVNPVIPDHYTSE